MRPLASNQHTAACWCDSRPLSLLTGRLSSFVLGNPLSVFLLLAPTPSASQAIELEIVNLFRAFDYLGAGGTFDRTEAASRFARYRKGADESISKWVQRLADAGALPCEPYRSVNRGHFWRDRSAALQSRFCRPTSIPVRAKYLAPTTATPLSSSVRCTWFLNMSVARTVPCLEDIEFDVPPGTTHLGVALSEVAPPAQPMLSIEIAPKLRIILGLGDSYGSGEGSPDVPAVLRSDVIPACQTLSEAETALILSTGRHPARLGVDDLVRLGSVWERAQRRGRHRERAGLCRRRSTRLRGVPYCVTTAVRRRLLRERHSTRGQASRQFLARRR